MWRKAPKKIIHNNAELALRVGCGLAVDETKGWGQNNSVAAVAEWHDKMATTKAEVRANDKMLLAQNANQAAAEGQEEEEAAAATSNASNPRLE